MIEIKESGKQLSNACELYQLIPKDKLSRIFETSQTVGAECDYTFLGFEEVYKAVTLFVPKNKIILHLGCGYTFQSWCFRDYRKYIAVDHFDGEPLDILKILEIPRFDFYYISIQRFIDEVFSMLGYTLDEVFAVCSYVPDEEAREMVRKFFPHCLVYYPA